MYKEKQPPNHSLLKSASRLQEDQKKNFSLIGSKMHSKKSHDTSELKIIPCKKPLEGTITLPGDKSITHRVFLMAALLEKGESLQIENPLFAQDTLATLKCLEILNFLKVNSFVNSDSSFHLESLGLKTFNIEGELTLDAGNSGTTARLLMGFLAPRIKSGSIQIKGDDSLQARPMARVAVALKQQGANIQLVKDQFLPAQITKAADRFEQGEWKAQVLVPSAQVKSAFLFAALARSGPLHLSGQLESRDHTERLFNAFGLDLKTFGKDLKLCLPFKVQNPKKIQVPGDLSSAAFWITAALLIPGSILRFEAVGLNPYRTGFIKMLIKMGAQIHFQTTHSNYEPKGEVKVHESLAQLRSCPFEDFDVASCIDELPLLALIGAFTPNGLTIQGAKELKTKESNRIINTCHILKTFGIDIVALDDGFEIRPLKGKKLKGGQTLPAINDHRMTMLGILTATLAHKPSLILGASNVDVSYPQFFKDAAKIGLLSLALLLNLLIFPPLILANAVKTDELQSETKSQVLESFFQETSWHIRRQDLQNNWIDFGPGASNLDQAKFFVIVILSKECPCSRSHEEKLENLYQRFFPLGVRFLAVHSNNESNLSQIQTHFANKFSFPIVQDEGFEISKALQSIKTPQVYLWNSSGERLYQGGVDSSHMASHAKEEFLAMALEDATANKKLRKSEGRVLGCRIRKNP